MHKHSVRDVFAAGEIQAFQVPQAFSMARTARKSQQALRQCTIQHQAPQHLLKTESATLVYDKSR
jgi:hypothetical protein